MMKLHLTSRRPFGTIANANSQVQATQTYISICTPGRTERDQREARHDAQSAYEYSSIRQTQSTLWHSVQKADKYAENSSASDTEVSQMWEMGSAQFSVALRQGRHRNDDKGRCASATGT